MGHSALPGTRLPPSKHLRPFTPSALTPSPSPSPPTLLVACAELCTLIHRIRFHSSHSIYHVAHTTQYVTFDRNCGSSPSQRGQAGSTTHNGSNGSLTRTRRHPGDAQAAVCGPAVGASAGWGGDGVGLGPSAVLLERRGQTHARPRPLQDAEGPRVSKMQPFPVEHILLGGSFVCVCVCENHCDCESLGSNLVHRGAGRPSRRNGPHVSRIGSRLSS